MVFLEIIQNLLGGGQNWQMDVINAKDLPKKILQIILFGETGQLRSIVKPHVDDPFYSRCAEFLKKLFRALVSKTNRAKMD